MNDCKIILIGGYCATGKSTFSRKLAEHLKIPCFNKDVIKEVIGDGFGAENTDVYNKNSAVTFSLMLHIAERFLQAGKPCILESNFKLSESEQLKELLDKYNAECLTFLFKGELAVLYKRYAEREKTERHWVHLTTGENREMFINWHNYDLNKISIGKAIYVDATDFLTINYEELFNKAECFIQGDN